MSVLPIRTLGDPVLRQPSRDVETFDELLERLAADMVETMYKAPGVGLAAPQIGLSLRFFVFDDRDGGDPVAVANPVILQMDGEVVEEEGCLSVPNLWYPTARAHWVRLEGQDVHGRRIRLEGEGLRARIFQHETDHLHGRLYLDRLSEEERRRAMAELREIELGSGGGRGRFRSRSGRSGG